MKLETGRLILRPWEHRDRDPFAAIVGDPHVMRFYTSTRTRQQADEWIDKMIAGLADGTSYFMAVERKNDGELLGLVGTANINFAIPTLPAVEIGWLLGKQFWGSGYAPEAARASLKHAFNILNLPEIVAFTARVNMPSQRVMEKLGMQRDPAADFDHPRVPDGHALQPHVLYRIAKPNS